ncbi:MAG TPA: deoxyribonuclease II family protein [Pirellulales bacterium]|nr:deoxyribonuclease II family protein [Pirellulales bacterium]
MTRRKLLLTFVFSLLIPSALVQTGRSADKLPAPTPLAGPDQPVDWLFVFKFNAASFPGCPGSSGPAIGSPGMFGGKVQNYHWHSQQYVFATSANPKLTMGTHCLGATDKDPLGATFAQIYDKSGYYYVLWNDQFYNNPIANKSAPAGHSKGMVAWNDDGEGFVLQVSTPSWPASGSEDHPRRHDGNTLGCIKDDDIEVSQHFFALRLTKADLIALLKALANASVVTSAEHPEIVQSGGPPEVQHLVEALGHESNSTECTIATLSTGVQLISKPSAMAAPPWQVVSAKLDGLPLRVASWWDKPLIYSTTASTPIDAWPAELGHPGPVEIAVSGMWDHEVLGLTGGEGPNHNHAKIGISTDASNPLCIFGDLNQQGALTKNYAYHGQTMRSSQNGRGGTFYVLRNDQLLQDLAKMLRGATAPESGPNGQ